MNRFKYLFILPVAISLSAGEASAAQTAPADSLSGGMLEEVVVTGSNSIVERNMLPYTVTTINRQAIEASASPQVLSVISGMVPSLFVTQKNILGFGVGSNGGSGHIKLRGVGGDRAGAVLMMVDGQPQFAGIYSHSVSDFYSKSYVDRVEVLRGPGSNVAIGIASSDGKARIHSAGVTDDPAVLWDNIAEQDAFLESMADACKGVFDHFGDKKLFINVANNLSVDCDCNGNPAAPKMAEFGILASLDPVALDRACVDMVFNSSDPGKDDLIERINSRHGTHILDAAEQLGIGSQKYKLVTIE